MGPAEDDPDRARLLAILVHEEERPSAVGALQGIRGHGLATRGVDDLTRDRKEKVRFVSGLRPVLGQETRREVLRQGLADVQRVVDAEHRERSPGRVALSPSGPGK